ncbi:MAG: hypothetical protein GC162_17685 [Planctomycetes bacterium]|nr:hypothetical protein [Planctomycetota bacterium]
MDSSKKGWITASVLTIALGIAWLLNNMHIIRGVDWVWTILLAIVGILTIVLGGINKLSIVVGPFMIVASVLSVMRQTGHLSFDQEVPTLVIVLGALMFVATVFPVPKPAWMDEKHPPAP